MNQWCQLEKANYITFDEKEIAQRAQRASAQLLIDESRNQKTIASRHASLVSLLINEIYAQYEYAGKLKPELSHYRTRGGAEIDLVLKTKDKLVGIECATSDDISPYRQRGMRSFLEKHSNAVGYFIAPVQKQFSIEKNIYVILWNNIG